MWHKIPRVFKSFYFLFGLFFIVWMLFIDSNDLYSQFTRMKKLKELERQKKFYKEMIQEVEKDREELLSDEALLEKFAREKYLMKKESEDLYVIVEEEDWAGVTACSFLENPANYEKNLIAVYY